MKKRNRSLSKKSSPDPRRASPSSQTAGQQTLQEILSQPVAWVETARQYRRRDGLLGNFAAFSREGPWLFVACGSSYYVSRTIAAQWSQHLGVACTAVPSSELLFAPDDVLRRTGARQVVLVSRSGKTTEVLRSAELLRAKASVRTLGVTCNESSVLEELCTHTAKLPWADEKSMVMTRSFTSILLLFERLAAKFAGDAGLASTLDAIPEKTTHWLEVNADKIRAFATQRSFADFVFLGQGAHYWLAQEAALKMTEMSSSYAQAFHTLEFRHGPKAIAGPDTLISFLLSEAAEEEELLLASEMKTLGAATMLIVNRGKAALQREHDLVIELGLHEPEFARLATAAIPAQLLGLAVGLRKGLNPDEPRNLARAVVLGSGKDAAVKRRNT